MSEMYCEGTEALRSTADFVTDHASVVFIKSGYVFDAFAHKTLDDLNTAGVVLKTSRLEHPSVDATTGYAHADDLSLGCTSADQVGSLVIYLDNCVADQSILLAHLTDLEGLPLYAATKVHLQWDRRGIMAVQPCAADVVPGASSTVVHIPCQTSGVVDWNGWFGCHSLSIQFDEVKLVLNDLGQPSCTYAKAFLTQLYQIEQAALAKQTVRWGERLITYRSVGDIIQMRTHWENKVAQLCARGAQRRRPIGFNFGC